MLATEASADLEFAHNVGRDNADQAWILSDRDAWYANPFYQGPPVAHPESDCGYYDEDDLEEAREREYQADPGLRLLDLCFKEHLMGFVGPFQPIDEDLPF